MMEAFGASAQEKCAVIGRERPDLDIEQICRERSEEPRPPEAFLLSGRSSANSLLLVSRVFLEDGQLLPCPAPPLVGAVFGPDWGFARAEVEFRTDGVSEFRLPLGRFETFRDGDIWGYRMCPIDNHQIPDAVRQLANIREELVKPRQQHDGETGVKVTVTEL
jgi:hypothetical protein